MEKIGLVVFVMINFLCLLELNLKGLGENAGPPAVGVPLAKSPSH